MISKCTAQPQLTAQHNKPSILPKPGGPLKDLQMSRHVREKTLNM